MVTEPSQLPLFAQRQKQLIVRTKKSLSPKMLGTAVNEYMSAMHSMVRTNRAATTEGSPLAMLSLQYEWALCQLYQPTGEDVSAPTETWLDDYLKGMHAKLQPYFGRLPILIWWEVDDEANVPKAFVGLAPQGVAAIPMLAYFVGPFADTPARAVVISVVDPSDCPSFPHYPSGKGSLAHVGQSSFSEPTLLSAVANFNAATHMRVSAQLSSPLHKDRPGLQELATHAKQLTEVQREWVGRAGCENAVASCGYYLERVARSMASWKGLDLANDATNVCVWVPILAPILPKRFQHAGGGTKALLIYATCLGEPLWHQRRPGARGTPFAVLPKEEDGSGGVEPAE